MFKKGDPLARTAGAMGGKKGKTGGFASKKVGADGLTGPQRARLAGLKGGKVTKQDLVDRRLRELYKIDTTAKKVNDDFRTFEEIVDKPKRRFAFWGRK